MVVCNLLPFLCEVNTDWLKRNYTTDLYSVVSALIIITSVATGGYYKILFLRIQFSHNGDKITRCNPDLGQ